MLRNIVVGRLRDPDDAGDRATLLAGLEAIDALNPPGRVNSQVGLDLGLREGNWHFAITADFTDAESYRAYDVEEEHNRIRRDHFIPVCAEITRVQFQL